MFNPHHNRKKEQRLPEVADLPQDTTPEPGHTLSDLAAFKVMLKRNLRHETPPADLLGNIRARVAKIRDAE